MGDALLVHYWWEEGGEMDMRMRGIKWEWGGKRRWERGMGRSKI